MKINTNKLMTFANFGKLKKMARQRIYELADRGVFDMVEIDGVKFILMNEKANKYKKRI